MHLPCRTTCFSNRFLPLKRKKSSLIFDVWVLPRCPLLNRTELTPVTTPGDGFNDGFPTSLSYCLVSASQSEKLLLFDTVQSELEEKIRRLEEDRHSIDITSGTYQGRNRQLSKIISFRSIYLIKSIRIRAYNDPPNPQHSGNIFTVIKQ